MNSKLVIIAGGSGTRLWPLSRQHYPKQFIKIFDKLSSFQQTLLRHKSFTRPTVIVGEDHRFIAAEQIREINAIVDLIIEPVQKNTAPCAMLAAFIALKENCENVLLVPADHYIDNNENYLQSITAALSLANEYGIATIGIKPTLAHTGYGYIKTNTQIKDHCYLAERFIEKPDQNKADEYLADGGYYWNSGIFAYSTNYMLEVSEKIQNKMFHQIKLALENATKDIDFIRLPKNIYSQISGESIDYAIMEKITNIALVESAFGWNDLGSWASLWEVSNKDENNNYLQGSVITKQVNNSYIYSDKQLTTVLGLDDIIVVNTQDALLIASKNESENIKIVVAELLKAKRREASEHIITYRPWGYYYTIDEGDLYKAKRIVVHPQQRLSAQYHNHRAEHWVIVQGWAEVTLNDEIFTLKANESIYIPQLSTHRITNVGDIDLHLIEVQTGSYLGEDDIVRTSDDYGRK